MEEANKVLLGERINFDGVEIFTQDGILKTNKGVSYEVGEMLTYTNAEIGISFEYPDYYGEPSLMFSDGKQGEVFYLRLWHS